MKKQTSVDWLYDKLEHTRFPTVEELNEILQTARQMHREEVEESYFEGLKDTYQRNYYEETFNT